MSDSAPWPRAKGEKPQGEGQPETGQRETGQPETGQPETGQRETGLPRARPPDARPLEARQPDAPLDRRPMGSGDEWVIGPEGQKFWGKHGSAGLLVHHPDLGVLLQLRATWSHFGDTWGLPGGARHEDETAVQAAIREADEEAGVPAPLLRLEFDSILKLGFWSYTTVVASTIEPFEPVIGDAESAALRWVPFDEVADLPLHPGFADSWPGLRAELGQRVVLIVDSANVVGSRPNGWWKDRLGATERFAAQLNQLVEHGIPAGELDLERDIRWPETKLIVEGQAARAQLSPAAGNNRLRIVSAPADGDRSIVETVSDAVSDAARDVGPDSTRAPIVFVVTADRELIERVHALGARVLGPRWLWRLLDAHGAAPQQTTPIDPPEDPPHEVVRS